MRLGRDKATFVFDGVSLLERVIANVAPVCAPVVIATREGQDLHAPPSTIIVRDRFAERGPLSGIASGLEALAPDAELAFVVATDMPFTGGEFIRALVMALGEHDVACVVRDGVAQPIGAVYRTSVFDTALALLSAPRGSPRMLLDALDTQRIEEDVLWRDAELAREDPARRALEDIDTEADVARLSPR